MTNAKAQFNKSLCPWKPEGSLGWRAKNIHLDSHTAPELCLCAMHITVTFYHPMLSKYSGYRRYILHLYLNPFLLIYHQSQLHPWRRKKKDILTFSFLLLMVILIINGIYYSQYKPYKPDSIILIWIKEWGNTFINSGKTYLGRSVAREEEVIRHAPVTSWVLSVILCWQGPDLQAFLIIFY